MNHYSHRGQILPLKNQMVPTSKDTTFHASFDKNLDGFGRNGRIEPIGPTESVYIQKGNAVVSEFGAGINPNQTDFYISLWANPEDVSTNQMVIAFDRSHDNSARFYLSITSGTWSMGIHNYQWRQTSARVKNGWSFIELEGSGGNASMRVDGALIEEATYSDFELGVFGIGKNLGFDTREYSGYLSDIKIFFDGTLEAHYLCNEKEGHVLFDSSGNGNDAIGNMELGPGDGPTVASITPYGKFGGAANIEIASRNTVIMDTWHSDGGRGNTSRTGQTSQFGNPIYIWRPAEKEGTANIYLHDTDLDATTSKEWTLSIMLKRVDGKVVDDVGSMYIHTMDSSGNRVNDSNIPDEIIDYGNGWYRIVRSIQMQEAQPMYLVGVSAVSSDTDWLISDGQVEPGLIASTPMGTGGSRKDGLLEYPIRVLNPKEGTIAFWAKVPFKLPYGGWRHLHMSTTGGAYGSTLSLNMETSVAYPSRIIGVHWASESGQSNHTSINYTGVKSYNNGDWNHFVITWDKNKGWYLYLNGYLEANSGSNLPLKDFDADRLSFMGMQMDELRIENRMISDIEIKAWVESSGHYNHVENSSQ